jgi:hypothetical protein
MKICLIVDDYMPYSIKAAARMMHELACELKERGYEVTVITPQPKQKEKLKVDNIDNIIVCRFRSGQIKNIGKIKRTFNESLLSLYAWRYTKNYLKNNHHELIIYYSPTIFFGSFVSKLKNLWNAKSYLILRDFFPQWAVDQGMIKKDSFIESYFRYFEKINYEHADTIGVMSPKNLEMFKNIFYDKYKLEVLYNWSTSKPVEKNIDYKQILGLIDKTVYFYGGNIGYAQDMMNLIRLVKYMKKYPQAHFVFVGVGDEVEFVQKSIIKDDLTNLTLLPAVSQKEFQQMLVSFDIGLFSLHRNHTTHNFPGKVLGYMAQSLPVLGSINEGNDLKNIIEDFNAGYISLNGDDKLFFQNAELLLDNKNNCRHVISENAKKLLNEKFSVKSVANQILR